MNAYADLIAPGITLFLASLALTAVSLWVGGRLAPWFLEKPASEPPSLRSYFLEPWADAEMTPARVVAMLVAAAIMLTALLVIAIAVKFGGVPLA